MAQNMAKTDGPPKTHNVAAMMDAIRDLDRELAPLEKQRTDISTEIRNKKRRLKDYGISVKYFDAVRAIHRMDDEDEQNTALDNIRTVARALRVGGQAGLFPSDDEVEAAKGEAADPAAEGRAAAENNENGDANPYDEGTDEHAAWAASWMAVQAERADGLKPKANGKGKAAH